MRNSAAPSIQANSITLPISSERMDSPQRMVWLLVQGTASAPTGKQWVLESPVQGKWQEWTEAPAVYNASQFQLSSVPAAISAAPWATWILALLGAFLGGMLLNFMPCVFPVLAIKLLGITKRVSAGVELRVHPCLVPTKRLIANVEGAMNAVMVQADAVGTTLYYGKGAGGEATASAVIADVVDVARAISNPAAQRVPALAFQPDAMSDAPVLPVQKIVSCYYLRLRVSDRAGVLADLTSLLAKQGISIDAMLQREAQDVGGASTAQTDLIILTHEIEEGLLDKALSDIQNLTSVLAPVVRIRKEELA